MSTDAKIKKLGILIIILVLTLNIIGGIASPSKSYASQEKIAYSERINSYPGYAELIKKLKAAHPNWQFNIFYTGLDWNQVIKNETVAWHGRNLIDANKTGDWVCQTCSDTRYDNGSWKCASEATVSYYMDPRNFLNDDYIFQFEESVFNENIHTVNGILSMTQGTFLAGQENAEAILQACKNVNINPYQVFSRVLQEQGYSGSIMSKGNNGYYNVFNVGAWGSSSSEIIANATEYAKNNGWDTLGKSIIGGIDFLKSKYIGIGQNTIYLQKFDVDDSDGILYYHQYMQNVSAAYTECQIVRNIYKNIGLFENNITFLIPVYENMPADRSPIPGTQSIVTQNVKIKENKINVRESKNINSKSIAELNQGDIVLRIEIGNQEENGHKWDKVVLSNGIKGYIISDYLEKIEDVKNCDENVIVNSSVNLRNGPGTSGTSVITTLTEGQALIKIETDKYNGLDGYNWDRVILSDGRQGYIVSEYISKFGDINDKSGAELIKVICDIGINVRETPGTDKKVLTYLPCGSVLTRIEQNVSTENGYIWDKIVTGGGIVGYIARGDSSESFVEKMNKDKEQSNNIDTTPNDNFKIEDKYIIIEPDTTIEKIKEKYTSAIVIKDGKEIDSVSIIGTNYIVKIDGKEYSVIKIGDIDGNASIDAIDLLKVRKYLLGKENIENCFYKAMDIFKDNVIDAKDLLKLRKILTMTDKIQIY